MVFCSEKLVIMVSRREFMLKKIILKYLIYFPVFALLALAEKSLGLTGFANGLVFALVYCREKCYVYIPCFVGAELAVNFSLPALSWIGAAAVISLVTIFIHYKKSLRYRIAETVVLTVVSLIPYAVFTGTDLFSIAVTSLSFLLAPVFHYLAIIALYPPLVRGLKYRLNPNEKFALGLYLALLSAGLASFRPFEVSIYYFALGFGFLFLRSVEKSVLPFFGVCAGLGAAVGTGEIGFLAYSAFLSVVASGTSSLRSPLAAGALSLSFLCGVYFFNAATDLFILLPFVAGCFAGMCFPRKFFKKILAFQQGYHARYALRTMVNRDREDLASRLKSVSSAFGEMQKLLSDEQPEDDPEKLVKSVCENGCIACPSVRKCLEKIPDLYVSVKRLVYAALNNGKTSILDAGVSLGENCTRLGFLINLVNDSVRQYRKMQERKSGIEQGKEMVISVAGGVAGLLDDLALSVNKGLSFDPEPEKKVMEKLAQANVVATDVMIYNQDENKEITLVVRESDVNKPALKDIVSEVIGTPMAEYARRKDVKGMASVCFCPAPVYKILYGESFAAKESRSGDSGLAVKIGKHKLMFVLSDGMGTGKNASDTAERVARLIESFYKAGFGHKTIFTSVSRLLALRKNEDFSALDVVVIDTQNGEIDFIKQGGRESYLFSGNSYEVIDGGTLPIGILSESDPVVESRRLKTDDVVIMMSDGVADAVNEGEVAQIIHGSTARNMQEAADALLSDAVRLSGKRKDDMTVIALRLVRA